MSRRWSIPMLVLLASCQAPSPTPTKDAAPAPKTDNKPVSKPEPVTAPTPEGGSSTPTETIAEPGPAPAWFSPNAFEHAAIIRQDTAGTKLPTGESSAMIVLELPAGTTPEQCIENFKAKLAEGGASGEPPTSSVMPQGHLSLRGKTDTYAYTVVCGIAKDKPTMFLSYIQ